MRPPTPERSDPLQLGVHLATDPVNLPDFVFDDLERLQPQILKINHNEWPEKVGQLASRLPERNWIIETRPSRGGAAPNDYVREIMPELDKLLQELTSHSLGSLALEIQPEPYGELGSLSRLSTDPYELGRWWRAVVEQLREMLPQQMVYLFPNLADQLNPRGGRELSAQNMRSFLSEMGEFLYGIDGVAVGFEFVTEQLSGGDLLNYAHTLLTSYSNLGVPLWLTHVWAELVNVPAGGQPQLYADLLDMIEKEFPLVHGVVFFPFYSLRDQFKETTWAGSPALRQFAALMRRQPLPALAAEPAGFIWLGGAQQVSDGRWQTVTQVTVRQGPNPSSEKVGVLPEGVTLTLAGDPEGSYLPVSIDLNDLLPPETAAETLIEGWVWGQALQRGREGTAVNRNVGVNVRQEPSNTATILGVLRRGAQVEVVGDENNDFLPIRALTSDLVVQNQAGSSENPAQEVATQVSATPEQPSAVWRDPQALLLLPSDSPRSQEQRSAKQEPLLSSYDRGSGPSLRVMNIEVPAPPQPGQPVPLRFSLENDGSLAWARGSQLRLIGHWLEADGLPLDFKEQHAASQIPELVPPGEQIQTVLELKAPPASGEFRLEWELELSVAGYEPSLSHAAVLLGVGALSFQVSGILIAEEPLPGEEFRASALLKNDGVVDWSADQVIHMKVSWQRDGQLLSRPAASAATSVFPKPVHPGQDESVDITLTAPAEPGAYALAWQIDLVRNGYEAITRTGLEPLNVIAQVDPTQEISRYVEQIVPTKGGPLPEPEEPAGAWLFRFGREWPQTVWPGEEVTLELELENQTRQEIPAGELWVREWVGLPDDEEREPAGSGLPFDEPIPPGKSYLISVPYLMPREAGDYRWYFELETGSLTPPEPVPSLTVVTRVASDESARQAIAAFHEDGAEFRRDTVAGVANTIPNLEPDDPLREQLLAGIMLVGLLDEDWHVGKAALDGLYDLLSSDLGPDLTARARAAVSSTAEGAARLEALLKRRMRREVREWGESLLEGLAKPIPDPAVAEPATPPAGAAASNATAEPVRDATPAAGPAARPDAPPSNTETAPARTSASGPPERTPANLPAVPPTPPEIRNVQVIVNQKLAESEPAGDQDRLTLTISAQSVLAKLRLNGQEFNYASPFSLDRQKLAQLALDPAGYGELLFKAILNEEPMPGGDRLTATIEALDRVQTSSNDFVIELVIDPSIHASFNPNDAALHNLWWELLKQPDRQGVAKIPLATQTHTPLYRRLIGPARPPQAADPLKVLVAICNPRELGTDTYAALERLAAVDVEQESDILETALQPLEDAKVGEFEILGGPAKPASWAALRGALQDEYHVLHIVAHGIFFGGNFSLVMEGENREALFVSPEEFQGLIKAHNSLRLVVLTACQSAIDSSGSSLQGLGPRLVQAGLPAVIAMQDLIQVEAAQKFHQYFYNGLARHGQVDRALATARHHLYHEIDEPRQWAVPVLYLGSGDGQLFKLPEAAPTRLAPLATARTKSYKELAGAGDPSLAKATQQLRSDAHRLGLGQEVVAAMQAMIAPGMALRAAQGPEELLALPQDGGKLSGAITAPVRFTANELKAYITANTPLILDETIYPQLAGALSAGKHIVLTGPPGTGKTSLALAIAELAQARGMNRGATLTTATPDWTTFDTIGGYVPGRSQTLQFKPGMFLETIREGRWLIIDEMNRAEIDKAFGELFTVLSGQQVDLPYTVGEDRVRIMPPAGKTPADWWPQGLGRFDYVRHPNWRIIGTMNVFDRSFLFSMSFAFMRRFAFIDVAVPEAVSYAGLRQKWLADRLELADDHPDVAVLVTHFNTLFDQARPLMMRRALGPAIALDMIRYLAARGAPWPSAVAEAMMLYVVPQLDALEPTAIFAIYQQMKLAFGVAEQGLLLPRIRELYPHIRAQDWEEAFNGG